MGEHRHQDEHGVIHLPHHRITRRRFQDVCNSLEGYGVLAMFNVVPISIPSIFGCPKKFTGIGHHNLILVDVTLPYNTLSLL